MDNKIVSEYDLYIDEFNNSVKEIKEEFDKSPSRVARQMRKVAKEIKYNNKSKLSLKEALDKTLNSIKITDYIFYGLILLIVLSAPLKIEGLTMYIFGLIFFFAGLFIGLKEKFFGLIFLFSHGGSGLAIMIGTIISTSENTTTLLTTQAQQASIFITINVVLLLIAVLAIVLYNISDHLKKIEYFKIIPLALIFIVLLACKNVLPIISIINQVFKIG